MHKIQPFIQKCGNFDEVFYFVSYYDEEGKERHYGKLYGDSYETIEDAKKAKSEFEQYLATRGY